MGAGFAGLSAAVRLTRDGARVLVLEARARLGGRATAFADRETGELVDNGQHVLLGCYRETLAFLHDIGASDYVRMQPELAVTIIDRGRPRVAAALPAHCRHRWHLLAGVFGWPALGWGDRLAIAPDGGGRFVRRSARGELGGSTQTVARRTARDETVATGSIRHGQTPRLRELLWDPLALAALNQPPETAARRRRSHRVLAEMFGPDPASAAIVLPTRPLHQMYAEPAREFIERHGGSVRTGATARVRVDGCGGRRESTRCARSWSAAAVICAVPWLALPDIFDGDARLAAAHARCRARAPRRRRSSRSTSGSIGW